jgi:alpha-beta hydrolase superfamily lysophospholipase
MNSTHFDSAKTPLSTYHLVAREKTKKGKVLPDPLGASKLTFRYLAHIKKILMDRALENASQIQKPTLKLQGGADVIALPDGAKRLYESLRMGDKSIRIFPDVDHWFNDTFSPAMPRAEYDPAKKEHLSSIVNDWLRTH